MHSKAGNACPAQLFESKVKVLHEKDFTHAQVVFKEAAHAKAAQEAGLADFNTFGLSPKP